jgi:hypothetical protein
MQQLPAAAEQTDDKHQQDRANEGDQDALPVDPIHHVLQMEEVARQPPAEQPAEDPNNDIADAAKTGSLHNQSAQPTTIHDKIPICFSPY